MFDGFGLPCYLLGVVTNVTVDIEESTKKVEIRWEEPMESNGIITGYNFTVTGHPTLNMFVSGGSAKYIKFDFLGKQSCCLLNNEIILIFV